MDDGKQRKIEVHILSWNQLPAQTHQKPYIIECIYTYNTNNVFI